jgi:pimeloyl-ACP methyl ester carboxylesterase
MMKNTKCTWWKLLPAAGIAALGGWVGAQLGWALGRLAKIDIEASLADHDHQGEKGEEIFNSEESDTYRMRHSVEDGIERIVYTPKERRFETPILMAHGMWHGAWCWRHLQEVFAVHGWESIAFSLPGHGGSPTQRPITLCTLDYYLGFLKSEVERLPHKPVLMGHSMGGALTQWYLKYIGDDLPAAILVAPWVSHSVLAAGFFRLLRLDPLGCMMISPAWNASPLVRSPRSAARLLMSEHALLTPEELHARLGPESALVLFQHNPPFWQPPEDLQTPMLWLAGEADATFRERDQRRSALFYKSDYYLVEDAGHNLMMEQSYRQSAAFIHRWLSMQGIA